MLCIARHFSAGINEPPIFWGFNPIIPQLKYFSGEQRQVARPAGGIAREQSMVSRLAGGIVHEQLEVPRLAGGIVHEQSEVPRLAGGIAHKQLEVPRLAGGIAREQLEVPRLAGGVAREQLEVSRLAGGIVLPALKCRAKHNCQAKHTDSYPTIYLAAFSPVALRIKTTNIHDMLKAMTDAQGICNPRGTSSVRISVTAGPVKRKWII